MYLGVDGVERGQQLIDDQPVEQAIFDDEPPPQRHYIHRVLVGKNRHWQARIPAAKEAIVLVRSMSFKGLWLLVRRVVKITPALPSGRKIG